MALPAELVNPLRDSVYGEIRHIASAMSEALTIAARPREREVREYRRQVDEACALPDVIGWDAHEPRATQTVALAEHGLALWASLLEACADAERALGDVSKLITQGKEAQAHRLEARARDLHSLAAELALVYPPPAALLPPTLCSTWDLMDAHR